MQAEGQCLPSVRQALRPWVPLGGVEREREIDSDSPCHVFGCLCPKCLSICTVQGGMEGHHLSRAILVLPASVLRLYNTG